MPITPPSFSSFPDFSALSHSGPSNNQPESNPSTKEKRRTKGDGAPHKSKHHSSDKHKKRKRDKHRSDTRSGHRSLDLPSDEDNDLTVHPSIQLRDDERLKEEDDRKLKEPILFYSDRKGDILNLQYGRLHAGDVPKYRLVGGTLLFSSSNDRLMMCKVVEKYWVLAMLGLPCIEITWAWKSVLAVDDA